MVEPRDQETTVNLTQKELKVILKILEILISSNNQIRTNFENNWPGLRTRFLELVDKVKDS